MERDEQPHPPGATTSFDVPPIQYCPWCGESIGSFWGRRGDDGSHWCETCQTFFRVELA